MNLGIGIFLCVTGQYVISALMYAAFPNRIPIGKLSVLMFLPESLCPRRVSVAIWLAAVAQSVVCRAPETWQLGFKH